MESLAYKISFLDGQEESGTATKIVVRDKNSTRTLSPAGAPTIVVLESGMLEIFDTQKGVLERTYKEGFLNGSAQACTITVLKY